VVAVSVSPDWREPEIVGNCVIVAASAAVVASTAIKTVTTVTARQRRVRFC
jgi:hypothetical protein